MALYGCTYAPNLKLGLQRTFVDTIGKDVTWLENRCNSLIFSVEARAGIEPAHTGFADQRITTLLPRRFLRVRKLTGVETVSNAVCCQI